MYLVSDLKKQHYKVNEAAEILGVSTKTIRNYDKRGILKAARTVGNHRVIPREELIRFLDEKGMILDDTEKKRRDIVYARVSSHDQKQHGDLDRQALFLIEHVPDMQNPLVLKEVGSGLNDKRKKLQQMLMMVSKKEVRNVYITYKDRLTRFGFNYLETMFNACGTNIVIVKNENEEKSDDLQKSHAVMDENELEEFVDRIGHIEPFDKAKESFACDFDSLIKAVKATLLALGYDKQWVREDLAETLNKKYLR